MRNFVVYITLTLLLAFGSQAQAQSADEVKTQVHDALVASFQKSFPHHFCECNGCKHTYDKNLKIVKARKSGNKILVWGKATASYKSLSSGDKTLVEIYAEMDARDMTMIELKWRPADCMKYRVLLGPDQR